MIRKLLSHSLIGLIAGPAIAWAQMDPLNETAYLEAKTNIQLFVPLIEEDGTRALQVFASLPQNSIISLEIDQISSSAYWQKNSPERINFPFFNRSKKRQESKNGWVCGVRVVDVNNEELRSSENYDREDLCLSLADLKSMRVLSSNALEMTEAITSYMASDNIEHLVALYEMVDQWKKSGFYTVNDVSPVSPLRNHPYPVVTSEYGMRMHPVHKRNILHKGIDLRASTGEEVVSALPGKVLAIRSERAKNGTLKGYGHYVIVVHPEQKMETLYAHLSRFRVKNGQAVSAGSLIALSGNTGIGTAPHLHFETKVKQNGNMKVTDPRNFIGSLLTKTASLFHKFFSLS